MSSGATLSMRVSDLGASMSGPSRQRMAMLEEPIFLPPTQPAEASTSSSVQSCFLPSCPTGTNPRSSPSTSPSEC